jgi:hypothetical protein
MIAEYSDKTPHPRSLLPLGNIGERGAEGGVRGLAPIEENLKKCHHNLQTAIRKSSSLFEQRTFAIISLGVSAGIVLATKDET